MTPIADLPSDLRQYLDGLRQPPKWGVTAIDVPLTFAHPTERAERAEIVAFAVANPDLGVRAVADAFGVRPETLRDWIVRSRR